jgi:hypothetical protein
MIEVDLNQVNRFILRKHHLKDDSKIDDILQITDDICGLHATSPTTPYLSLFARTHTFEKEYLEKELYINKSLGKIRCMRRTIFILPKAMIPIAYAATNDWVEKRRDGYLKYINLISNDYNDISVKITNMLKNKELPTSAIKKALNKQMDVSGIINLMCDECVLIRGRFVKSWKDRRYYYSLFKNYFPDIDLSKTNEKKAITRLIQWYLRDYGPVTEKDITWWIKTTKTKVRNALKEIKENVLNISISDLEGDYIMLASDEKELKNISPSKIKTINFLPHLDPYIMGYKDRVRYIDPQYYDYVFDRSGNATMTILLDGRIIGIWDCVEKPEPQVKLFFFEKIEDFLLKKTNLKAKKIGEFICENEVEIKLCNDMVPLPKRTMGGFMTPLKNS